MTEPIIAVAGLSVTYGVGVKSVEAVRDVSLSVHRGEAVGVVGESGSGKTTLARVIVGLVQPTAGEVRVGSTVMTGRPSREDRRSGQVGRRVQMVFQDPYSSLDPRQRAWSAVAEALRVWHDLPRREAKLQALALLGSVGISREQAHLFPGALLGGQRQRVSIARALAPQPESLVADEPTSSVDQSAQAQLLNLLRRLQRERDLAILLISHDLSVIRYLTSSVYVMRNGEVVESGPTQDVFSHPAHPYTRRLIASIPGRTQLSDDRGVDDSVEVSGPSS